MRVYAIIDIRSSTDHPLGDAVETFLRREYAERFIEKVRGEAPDLARYLRIEECELEAGGRNSSLEPGPTHSPSPEGERGRA